MAQNTSSGRRIPAVAVAAAKHPKWDHAIPPKLRPLVRAFLLGYGSSVAPRVLTLLLQRLSRRYKRPENTTARQPLQPFFPALFHILRTGFDPQRFPVFCAALVPLRRVIERILGTLDESAKLRLSRWLATFVAAWCSLSLLQSKPSPLFTDVVEEPSDDPSSKGGQRTIKWAGRTLDLTLFAVTRAVDVIVGELWSQRRERRMAAGKWTKTEKLIQKSADPALFALSCTAIMWAWFYTPTLLPPGYNKWIGAAAAVDVRLIEALRRFRTGEMQYGKDNGQAPLIQSMCADYKWPMAWGDPAASVPFPCEVVHMGVGPSCEHHALSRFYHSWRWSLATYLPLNLLIMARNPSFKNLKRALISASRSSAFLGAFIAFFYYGVCLARARVGPLIVGKDRAARQRIDSGICVGTGCVLCGWSILLEHPGRRKDMALFVAPRALATFLPRKYGMDKQWRENLVFAISTAVAFTCAMENQARVRGVLGNVLGSVLKA
ncbi:integral membrane protein [Pyricularia oryzae]|uniref:Integral membrane protein n=1 Tax=Pyricularia oryzae TaxID=318829 RepID=A0A4P7NJ56_PYROR|nr:integral membrane protein [Pyricularia oryzae]KAI7925023.1 integral membrane protein [Pyricularia oryzae]QBZ62087.1 hypothetical protein PoMZ_10961 [Pyricularia oryzae]